MRPLYVASFTGNLGEPGNCNFNVAVVDTTAPTITCPAPVTAECLNGGATVTPGVASGSDVCQLASVTTHAQTFFSFGTTQLAYTATDAGNNKTICNSTVTVQDTSKPSISCPAPATIECTGNRSASFTPVAATASDACAGVTVSNPPTATFALGPTTLNYSVTDAVGLGASCTSSVTVADTTKPSVTCPPDPAPTLAIPSLNGAVVASLPSASASDTCSSDVTLGCNHVGGEVFPLGRTQVTCTATTTTASTTANNTNSCNFGVQVSYPFNGFFQPVDNLPTLNAVKSGASIPVKFSLNGNFGLTIFASSSPLSQKVTCPNSSPVDDIETVTAGNSTLSYDPSTNQYSYIWKTNSAWAGTCRQLNLKLADGTDHVASFEFK